MITVCDLKCDFSTIYDAIEQAQDGDIVEIASNQVINEQVILKKSIHLKGKNNPILDGRGKSKMLLVLSSDIEISGLTIKNSEVSYIADVSGIRVEQVKNVYIHDNTLINNAYGIYLAKAKNVRIENNTIVGVYYNPRPKGCYSCFSKVNSSFKFAKVLIPISFYIQ